MVEVTQSFSLREILRVFFSHKAFFIIIPLTLVISAYIGAQMRIPMYEASVRMFVKAEKTTEADFYRGLPSRSIISDHAELVRSNTVLSRVVDALELYSIPQDYEKNFASPLKRAMIDFQQRNREPIRDKKELFNMALSRLGSRIDVAPVRDSNVFLITVRDYTPGLAIRIANSVSRSYIMFDMEQQIEETKLKYGEKNPIVLQLQDYVEEFRSTLSGERIPDLQAIGPASVKIVAQAEGANLMPAVPKHLLMALSFFTGIFLAVVMSGISEYSSKTFNSPRKVVEHLNLPLLGAIPKRGPKEAELVYNGVVGNSNYTRAFQIMSEKLSLLFKERQIKTILITDSEGSAETPIITSNIGILMAGSSDRRVLIIDADMRSSIIPRVFNIADRPGLADVIEKRVTIIDAIQSWGANLYILTAGQTDKNPFELLDSTIIRENIDEVKDRYDLVIINCPDLSKFTDPLILSSITDGTILVINEGKVRIHIFDAAIAPLKQSQVNILGTILNSRKYVIPSIVYKIT